MSNTLSVLKILVSNGRWGPSGQSRAGARMCHRERAVGGLEIRQPDCTGDNKVFTLRQPAVVFGGVSLASVWMGQKGYMAGSEKHGVRRCTVLITYTSRGDSGMERRGWHGNSARDGKRRFVSR